MRPGTVLFDKKFKYTDGSYGEKLLIVLNDGSQGYYIVVKTTSNSNYKGIKYGCQNADRYPNFFLPKGSCWFNTETWVLLNQYFDFTTHKLIAKSFDGELNITCYLPDKTTIEILSCAIESEDVSLNQENELKRNLTLLTNTKSPAKSKKLKKALT